MALQQVPFSLKNKIETSKMQYVFKPFLNTFHVCVPGNISTKITVLNGQSVYTEFQWHGIRK